MEFYLKIDLMRNQLKSLITVKKESSEELIKIIEKATSIDKDITAAINNFIADEELSFLISKGWKITDINFTISKEQLIKHYMKVKHHGTDISKINQEWPYIPNYEIGFVNTELLYNEIIWPTQNIKDSKLRGYVLKEHYDKNQEEYCGATKSKNENKEEPKHDISKTQQKQLRNSIIEKASKNDICPSGFKKEFVDKLTKEEQKYLKIISNLQLKLMRSDVNKKSG
jgi:hypothetical protein